ncbi:MAG: ABC transporter ATP-binding protein [Sphingobacteriales bacterium]|jgi:subfamily B ATP-binding cassette protein MsbA
MKSLRIIFRYISRYPKLVSLYFILNLLASGFSLISLALLGPFLTLIFSGKGGEQMLGSRVQLGNITENLYSYLNGLLISDEGKVKALGILCLIVVTAIILKNMFLYLGLYILAPIRNRILNDMRTDMFSKILQLPIGYFNEQRKGDIMSRLTNDLQDVEHSTISFLETFFREPITITFFLIYMVNLSPELSLFLLLFLPIAGLIIGRIGRSLKKVSTAVQEKLGDILTTIEETLSGMRVVKAFNAEGHRLDRFVQENQSLLNIKNRANRRRDLASPTSETLGIIAVCVVLFYGGRLVLTNDFSLSGPDFLTFIAIFTQIINPLKSFSSASYNIRRGAASIERIQALIHVQETVTEKPDAKTIQSFEKEIEFRNVSFSYGDKQVLQHINFTIKKGTTVALVGSSGSGKSTLADMVPRFHDVSDGEVLIDGVNIKDYKIKDIRNLMGIVTQEPILFNDSIAHNIALGMDEVDMGKVESAARVANAYSFISQKSERFDANIGDRGSRLSGGERQRLTIARAVFKNPPILILDEATSSLDTESERLVQDALNHLMEERTSLVIAHRLSTVRYADEIIVLDKGQIAERGKHDELIARDGIYKKLVELQEVR